MPLALGAFAEFTEEQTEDIGLIFEYITEAGPMAINGFPMFFSLQYLTRKETEEMFQMYENYKKIQEEFLKE